MCSKRALALDLLCSKNIIVAQIIERPIHGGSGVIFQSNCSVGRRILFKVVKPLSRLRSGLAGTLVLFLSAFALTACIVTGDQSIESNPKDPRAQDIADKIASIDLLPRQTADTGATGLRPQQSASRPAIYLSDGTTRNYGCLLIATGASPIRLDIPSRPDGEAD